MSRKRNVERLNSASWITWPIVSKKTQSVGFSASICLPRRSAAATSASVIGGPLLAPVSTRAARGDRGVRVPLEDGTAMCVLSLVADATRCAHPGASALPVTPLLLLRLVYHSSRAGTDQSPRPTHNARSTEAKAVTLSA